MLPTDRDVRFGADAILLTADAVTALGASKVLLVCGGRSFEASGAVRLLDKLDDVAEVRRWSDYAPNTDAADLIEGLRITDEFEPDVIVGVGGGSAMDMSKLLCAYQSITDETELHDAIRANAPVTERSLKLVLAPTTSGSGSEATHFAVVYIGDSKNSIAGPAMLPDTVIIDPLLTLSSSTYQRATSGIDAFAQATESLWSVGATDTSRAYAAEALPLLFDALPGFVNEPDADNATTMALGSHLAGRAIDVSKTTAAHALSYGITKGYGPSHGHAVALTLGEFIAAHADADPTRLQPGISAAEHADAMRRVLDVLGSVDGDHARDRFRRLCEELGLEMRLSNVGVTTAEQAHALAGKVNVERLGNNPIRFETDELAALVTRAM